MRRGIAQAPLGGIAVASVGADQFHLQPRVSYSHQIQLSPERRPNRSCLDFLLIFNDPFSHNKKARVSA